MVKNSRSPILCDEDMKSTPGSSLP